MLRVSQVSGSEAPRITLLEFDRRFGVFAEFVHYDYQTPTKLPGKTRAVASARQS